MVSDFLGNEWPGRTVHPACFSAVSLHPLFPCVISVSNANALGEKFCIGRKFKKISETRKNKSRHWKIQCLLRHAGFTHSIVTSSFTPPENK